MRHGEPPPMTEAQNAALLQETDDPELLNVFADLGTLMALENCTCEAGCTCDEEEDTC